MPRVSVCIPTFNGSDFIKEAVYSVQNQDYLDFEIVIVDNCSTDKTKTLVKNLIQEFDNIYFFENKINIGLARNLNKCVLHSKGEYIKFLCVDDILLQGCLRKMVNKLDQEPKVSLVCCSRLNIDQFGNCFGERGYSHFSKYEDGKKVINRCLYGGNFIGEPTATMFRKNQSNLLLSFREDLPQLMDMQMWFNLLEQGSLYFIKEPLCSIRIHDYQKTNENIKKGILIKDNILLFNEFKNKDYIKKNYLSIFRHKFMMTYRFWISKKYLKKNYFDEKIKIYGFKNILPLMGIIFFLRKWRKIFIINLKLFF